MNSNTSDRNIALDPEVKRQDLRYICHSIRYHGPDAYATNPTHNQINGAISTLGLRWSDFSLTWDVVVSGPYVYIMDVEKDLDFIISTCKSFQSDESQHLSRRQANVIDTVGFFLARSGLEWKDFNERWTVSIDSDTNNIGITSVSR